MRTQNLFFIVLTFIFMSACVNADKGDLFTCDPELAAHLAAGLYRNRDKELENESQCKVNETLHVAGGDACKLGCQTGCVCKPGYVYVSKKGCITIEESFLNCNKSEEMVCGKKECEKVCELDDDPLCKINFFDCAYAYSCFCMPGFIRTIEGKCIPVADCPLKLYEVPFKRNILD